MIASLIMHRMTYLNLDMISYSLFVNQAYTYTNPLPIPIITLFIPTLLDPLFSQ